MKKVLLAFGGNALIKADEPGLQKQQLDNAKEAAELVVRVLKQGFLPIIVHGNGPQIGNILIQQEEANNKIPPYTMDICNAQTQGSMGYMLERCITNILKYEKIERGVATLLTEVVVDGNDPGFKNPTKPVGPFYPEFRAHELRAQKGWTMKEDSGRGWRRVVPSPRPLQIVQLKAIQDLIELGYVVLACGGGGIPVTEDPHGFYIGQEAVIDKDRTAAMLAAFTEIDLFVLLTGVEKVALNFGKPDQKEVDRLTVDEAQKHLDDGQFPPGSMGPKIQSCINFVKHSGRTALVTTADAILRGDIEKVGTRIVPNEA